MSEGSFATRQQPLEVEKPDGSLVAWGWVCTLFFMPAALVIGIILVRRGNRTTHGGWMIGLSCAWLSLWVLVFMVGMAGLSAEFVSCVDAAQTQAQMDAC